jgi:hypothetical protein
MAKPFSFENCPSAFAWIDGETVDFEMLEYAGYFTKMGRPIGIEDADVVKEVFVG